VQEAKQGFNVALSSGSIYQPQPYVEYSEWLKGKTDTGERRKKYCGEEAAWNVDENNKRQRSIANANYIAEGQRRLKVWHDGQIDYWGSVVDIEALKKNLSGYDSYPSIRKFMEKRIEQLKQLPGQTKEARKLEQELYGQHLTADEYDKKWWCKNGNEYINKLHNKIKIAKRINTARALQKELNGMEETPQYRDVSPDKYRYAYWSDEKASGTYLNEMLTKVKDVLDKDISIAKSIKPGINEKVWRLQNTETRKQWLQEIKAEKETVEQAELKKKVESVREQETQVYGKPITPAYDKVNKEWWDNKNNVATYLGELTEKYKIVQSEKKQLADLEQVKLIMESPLEEVVKKTGSEDSPRKMFKLFDTVKDKAKKLAELGNNHEAEDWRSLAEQIQKKHEAINKPRLFVEVLGGNVNSLISQGHVRIGLYDNNTQKLQNYGNNPGTNFNEESQEHSYRHSIIFKIPLSEQQQNRCITTINELKKNEAYELLADNCIDSANKVLQGCETGVTIHDLLEQIPDNLDNNWIHQSLRYYAKKTSAKYK